MHAASVSHQASAAAAQRAQEAKQPPARAHDSDQDHKAPAAKSTPAKDVGKHADVTA